MQPCQLEIVSSCWKGRRGRATHLRTSCRRDCLHVKPLSRVILHGAKADDGNGVAFLLDDTEDVFGSNGVLAFSRVDGEEGGGRVVVESDVGGEGVLSKEKGSGRELRGEKEENKQRRKGRLFLRRGSCGVSRSAGRRR
jgi:hypothetical protein